MAIQEVYDEQKCSISELCKFAGVPRSAYYKWLNRQIRANEKFNQKLCALIKDAYEEKNGIVGFRQMTKKWNREKDVHVNEKRFCAL